MCALVGRTLLLRPNADPVPRSGSTPPTPAPRDTPLELTEPSRPKAGPHTHPAPAPWPTDPAEVPVPGDGPAGDHAVQRLLDHAAPADLPHATEKHLVALASRVLRAEATGTGREHWPRYFPQQQLRAPYQDVRIQAGTARRVDGHRDRVRVRLVWAGTDPAGQAQDGRTAQVLLARGPAGWRPTR
ncbi:hypothetical protein GCM10010349_78490 [Streptomyces flavofungini]|nr:hypothetical protein GCM10010349_78490 [Streptomyces flavofungini]